MPGLPDRTREEIEALLHAKLDHARRNYEKCVREVAEMDEIIRATLDTSDGALAVRQSGQRHQERLKALSEYQEAVGAFSSFVLHGKIPDDF